MDVIFGMKNIGSLKDLSPKMTHITREKLGSFLNTKGMCFGLTVIKYGSI